MSKLDDMAAKRTGYPPETQQQIDAGEHCHAHKDGDCTNSACPQNRDGEPLKTGRHCPLDILNPYEEEI